MLNCKLVVGGEDFGMLARVRAGVAGGLASEASSLLPAVGTPLRPLLCMCGARSRQERKSERCALVLLQVLARPPLPLFSLPSPVSVRCLGVF